MASKVVIRFGAENKTITGKDLETEREKHVQRTLLTLAANGATPGEKDVPDLEKIRNLAKEELVSQREAEKSFLDALLQAKMTKTKKLSEQKVLIDISEIIENSDDSVILDSSDLDKIVAGYEETDPEKRPNGWNRAKSMLRQLNRPEEVKEEKEKKEPGVD